MTSSITDVTNPTLVEMLQFQCPAFIQNLKENRFSRKPYIHVDMIVNNHGEDAPSFIMTR